MRILCLVVLLLSCASCSSGRSMTMDWQFPLHTAQERAAWDEATGRDLQYRDGLSSMFW